MDTWGGDQAKDLGRREPSRVRALRRTNLAHTARIRSPIKWLVLGAAFVVLLYFSPPSMVSSQLTPFLSRFPNLRGATGPKPPNIVFILTDDQVSAVRRTESKSHAEPVS